MRGTAIDDEDLRAEIAPCFVRSETGGRYGGARA